MIVTLAWKEVREHQGIWLTMVVMTIVLGLGLAKIVASDDAGLAVAVAALTILGMAAAYGVVCGSMMFAGEHEGGTLVFLDIFLGRRGLLWLGKFAIGVVLVITQALAVALAMRFLNQESPAWLTAIVGNPRANAGPGVPVHLDASVWFFVLPVVTLEAYAWGLLGSSLTQRVLAGASVAAVFATPVWLIAIVAPPEFFLLFRLVVTVGILGWSYANFLGQSRESALPPTPEPEGQRNSKERFLEVWQEYEEDDEIIDVVPIEEGPGRAAEVLPSIARNNHVPTPVEAEPARGPKPREAKSASEVLWWLTFQQAQAVLLILLPVCLLTGLLLRANPQVLWPLATLFLGVVCGTIAFAPEQRDLSYQFLAAQHFPVRRIWAFKVAFWLAVAVFAAFVIVIVHYLSLFVFQGAARAQPPMGFAEGPFAALEGFPGTLPGLLGPTLFLSVWLVYGFCTGQLVVWYCAKNILALLVSMMVAMTVLGLWLPSLLAGGMGGWQVWLTPAILLAAGVVLMRAWTGGRIKERRPIMALVGFGAVATLWALVQFGYRAIEIPNVGEPLDPQAFRARVPLGNDNAAGKAIHQAIAEFDDRQEPNQRWLQFLADAARHPVGVLEPPRADGHLPQLKHLAMCLRLTHELLRQAEAKDPDEADAYLAQALALSRNLRNKASLRSYLTGIEVEEKALKGFDPLLTRHRRTPAQMQRILDELNRHAAETPPPLDCLHAECFRSGGAVQNPNIWSFSIGMGGQRRIGERWLAGSIATSLEMPWEAERKMRLWQLVWAGQFRGIETPFWKLPQETEPLQTHKQTTRTILQGWLPAETGPDAGVSRQEVARLLDDSWLADERLFCSSALLRDAANRARWRVDAARQSVALGLYRMEQARPAADLQALVPKYLPGGLPLDPYSGQTYRYRVAPEVVLWSTGPDRMDHGGHKHGGHLGDDPAPWTRGGFDLVLAVPLAR